MRPDNETVCPICGALGDIVFYTEPRDYGVALFYSEGVTDIRLGGFKNEAEAVEWITSKMREIGSEE